MFKKILSIALALLVIASFAACGDDTPDETVSGDVTATENEAGLPVKGPLMDTE